MSDFNGLFSAFYQNLAVHLLNMVVSYHLFVIFAKNSEYELE